MGALPHAMAALLSPPRATHPAPCARSSCCSCAATTAALLLLLVAAVRFPLSTCLIWPSLAPSPQGRAPAAVGLVRRHRSSHPLPRPLAPLDARLQAEPVGSSHASNGHRRLPFGRRRAVRRRPSFVRPTLAARPLCLLCCCCLLLETATAS